MNHLIYVTHLHIVAQQAFQNCMRFFKVRRPNFSKSPFPHMKMSKYVHLQVYIMPACLCRRPRTLMRLSFFM